ncbi:MAG: hypothetical protein RL594_432 [Bacteroidota bacterium]
MQIVIREANRDDVGSIHLVAAATWEPTYRSIISQEQIQEMFEDLLSPPSIERQISNREGTYVLAFLQDRPQGFAYFAPKDTELGVFKLHRLYVIPDQQHSGVGSALVQFVEQYVRNHNGDAVELNVNRYNSAQDFYRKMGYDFVETVDIPYKTYWLNDYVMKKALR